MTDLTTFVADTLRQIIEGTKNASDDDNGFYLGDSSGNGVHFSLAVTTTEEAKSTSGGKGGINIKVLSAEIGKGGVTTKGYEDISRIDFTVRYFDLANGRRQSEMARRAT